MRSLVCVRLFVFSIKQTGETPISLLSYIYGLELGKSVVINIGLDKHNFLERKMVNIFLLISFGICNRLIETFLLSTHNICFG